MKAKRISTGVAYYWEAPPLVVEAYKKAQPGDAIRGIELAVALGTDYGSAIARAECYNAVLDNIRRQRLDSEDQVRSKKSDYRPGTIDWLAETFFKAPKFKRISKKQRGEYEKNLRLARDFVMKSARFGDARVLQVTPGLADKLFEKLRVGGRDGDRTARAAATMGALRRAWNVVHREHPKLVPKENPFTNMDLPKAGGDTMGATLEDLFAYVAAADKLKFPKLGTAAMIGYFWGQREADIFGRMSWDRYEPGRHVIVRHNKNKRMVLLPMTAIDETGATVSLFPELEARLASTPRHGPLIITRDQPLKGTSVYKPYSLDLMQKHDRKIRKAAKLDAKSITFTSFRHGGHTEAGEAGATDRELVAAGAWSSAAVLPNYVKQTSEQARNLHLKRLALRRSAWREANDVKEQDSSLDQEQKWEWKAES